MFSNFFIFPVVKEKINEKLALAIPTGAATTLVNDMIDTPPVVALKTIKLCLCNQKQQHICLMFYYMIFLFNF